jgi:hypothetical protein
LPLPVRESRGFFVRDENTGRRFRGWDISANVGVKPHAQVKDKMTRFMAEAAPHFAE